MAKHEFGIMQFPPEPQKTYNEYNPQKYGCIQITDEDMENASEELRRISSFFHSLQKPSKGLAWCGITLIPPASLPSFFQSIDKHERLAPLQSLILQAMAQENWIIHFGI